MSTKRLPSPSDIRQAVADERYGEGRPNEYGPIPDEASRFYDNCAEHAIPERMQSGGLSDSPRPRPQSIQQGDKPARFSR